MRSIGVRRVWLLSIVLLICAFGSYISWRASTIALAQTPCSTSGSATLAVIPKGGTAPTSGAGDPCATLTPPTNTATLAPQHATPTLIGSPGTRIPLVKVTSSRPSGSPYDDLLNEALAKGSVRVIVGLKMNFQPEGRIAVQAAQAQRNTIGQARRNLVARLSSHKAKVLSTDWTIPL